MGLNLGVHPNWWACEAERREREPRVPYTVMRMVLTDMGRQPTRRQGGAVSDIRFKARQVDIDRFRDSSMARSWMTQGRFFEALLDVHRELLARYEAGDRVAIEVLDACGIEPLRGI